MAENLGKLSEIKPNLSKPLKRLNLSKINQNNPNENSQIEKKIKSLSYTIQD